MLIAFDLSESGGKGRSMFEVIQVEQYGTFTVILAVNLHKLHNNCCILQKNEQKYQKDEIILIAETCGQISGCN